MLRKMLPRIADITPGRAPLILQVRWQHGGESLVDVSGLVGAFRAYAPLREDQSLFRRVRVGEHGTDVAWTDQIDMAADTLWRLAQEQSEETLTAEASRAWRGRTEDAVSGRSPLREVVRLGGLALQAEDCLVRAAVQHRGKHGGLARMENERYHQFLVWWAIVPVWHAVLERDRGCDLIVESENEKHFLK